MRTTLSVLTVFVLSLLTAAALIQLPLVSSKRPSSSSGSSTLNTSLIAYWKLDEASGTRSDSEPTGTPQNLTDNNTVGSTNGVIGSAAWTISGNSEYVSRSSEPDQSPGTNSFSVAGWVLMDTLTGGMISKYSGAAANREYRVIYSSGVSRFRFEISTNGTSTTHTVNASSAGAPATNTWYFVAAVFDAAANQLKISVNGGAFDTTTISEAGAGIPFGAAGLNLGAQFSGGAFLNGKLDEWGLWKKALSASEVTELYNSGSGKTCCPF